MGFSALGLTNALLSAVTDQGYRAPTPIQLAAIPAILAGQDLMAGAQTGTGKTAAFALPILQKLAEPMDQGVRALILVPTRELAQQVGASFVAYGRHTGLRTVITYGGVSVNTQMAELQAGADIVVATPGRLLDHLKRGTVTLSQLEFLVLDESDRMLDMGFIDDIKRIVVTAPKTRQTLLFSATFDEAIFKLSKNLLNDPQLIEVDTRNAAAQQVEQIAYEVDKARKREITSFLIGSRNWHQVLIFTRTKAGADALAKEMTKDGIKTQSIHGDKSQGAREKALEDFKQGQVRALVATDVASRGLDIEQLKYVINYELPHNAEDYIHRIGRTGRAGESGVAITLLSADERWLLEDIHKLLPTRLLQQWLPGYEPDLSQDFSAGSKKPRPTPNSKSKSTGRGRRR
ncbi:MAG: DEAD/DEAH box helicase [Reinekea forsetii]|jgi:superfamily II DNA/RNA helicase|uniref:DEAD-box ATP-dependent RNA helicase RhpA n=1 Tax=Reinekea forsetii TaxID=1336806 RepID=A0A2K8KPL2_9GAMM|nr:DEAD/DEAH box helicase [Reinekea forsetii]ATX75801.1 DEAD/DEAH box helicase [Reinekea forsetii]MDO7640831.1 DEAD/DEAH box helicase [Reinekea forsetii]MDO7643205.1 DEAD/DEAH box helicase [Reinekea forsetii]MDO7672802.1 DEAD/DEAH box helicase [Reinekea forsetii]